MTRPCRAATYSGTHSLVFTQIKTLKNAVEVKGQRAFQSFSSLKDVAHFLRTSECEPSRKQTYFSCFCPRVFCRLKQGGDLSNYMKCIMGVFSESLGVRFKKVRIKIILLVSQDSVNLQQVHHFLRFSGNKLIIITNQFSTIFFKTAYLSDSRPASREEPRRRRTGGCFPFCPPLITSPTGAAMCFRPLPGRSSR